MKSATTVLSCYNHDNTSRFVIIARSNVLTRVGGHCPNGAFVPTPPSSRAYKYGGYGCVGVIALRGVYAYLRGRSPRVILSRRIQHETRHSVLGVVGVGWRSYVGGLFLLVTTTYTSLATTTSRKV